MSATAALTRLVRGALAGLTADSVYVPSPVAATPHPASGTSTNESARCPCRYLDGSGLVRLQARAFARSAYTTCVRLALPPHPLPSAQVGSLLITVIMYCAAAGSRKKANGC
jgi:hypothetical protein